jgi:geranyl diphosphate 2-C-methyltransferase
VSGAVVGGGAEETERSEQISEEGEEALMPELKSPRVTTTDYQRDVANYWDTHTNDPVNLELGKVDDIYHHHYGLGDPDPAVLQAPDDVRDDRITRELHRLETAQADLLLDNLGTVRPEDRVLDAGSGRGGTSIMAHTRFGCRVDGVTISEYQVNFANDQAERRGCSDKVKFHLRNMLDTGFGEGRFRAVWTNETTMYVDLFELYREFRRLLPRGGRYVCITGCYNDVLGGKSASVRQIDDHYICDVHPRSTYFKALAANDLVPIKVLDLTPQTIPYWELRSQSSVRTGIEEAFLGAYREGSFHYLMIVADRA